MNVLDMLRKQIIFDKKITFMLVSIIIVALYTFHTSSYNMGRINHFAIQAADEIIRSNSYVFSNSPLQNTSLINDTEVVVVGVGAVTMPTEFIRAYDILSYHPSWILNLILSKLMVISQFNLIIVGVIIASFSYKPKTQSLEDLNTNKIIKKSIITIFSFVALTIFIVSILGIFIGNWNYIQTRDTEEMSLIMDLFYRHDLWIPDIAYYIQAIMGTFIHLTSHAIFGFFVGWIIKNSVISIMLLLFIANYFFPLLFMYPFTPTYFFLRVSSFFMLTLGGLPPVSGTNFLISLFVLIAYLVIILLLSKIIIAKHIKNQALIK
ncbi:MAG: hypothetical protein FWF81_10840 [Defluviitaleaceae bacterium]|nr:hypothetical protein [Defluviitaleaceae bacterium]